MRTTCKRGKKGVSPVIATIIIVAIAIVMSISVAYWMLGLGASFTRFEKLEFVTAYAIKSGNYFNVTMNVKNTGSADATIDFTASLLNGRPPSYYTNVNMGHWVNWTFAVDTTDIRTYTYNGTHWIYNNTSIGNPQITLAPGVSKDITLSINGSSFVSGMTLEIMLHTATGKDYPKVVVLP